jgi:hypothetical protein
MMSHALPALRKEDTVAASGYHSSFLAFIYNSLVIVEITGRLMLSRPDCVKRGVCVQAFVHAVRTARIESTAALDA